MAKKIKLTLTLELEKSTAAEWRGQAARFLEQAAFRVVRMEGEASLVSMLLKDGKKTVGRMLTEIK